MKNKIILYLFMLFILSFDGAAKALDQTKSYSHSDCIKCHTQKNPEIVKNWKNSSHAKVDSSGKIVADCVQCHGSIHQQSAATARRDKSCSDCHGGNKDPVVHSYKTSKHGAIMQIKKSKIAWDKPLKLANYRVPGCSYCHLYNGQHNTKKSIRQATIFSNKIFSSKTDLQQYSEQLLRQTTAVCLNCHSPRYSRRLFENGERMLAIARKKITEAKNLVNKVTKDQVLSKQQLARIKKQLDKMKKHFHNVYLGIAHQSPDYQWWHGQPALDGDLIQIKSLISNFQRMNKSIYR